MLEVVNLHAAVDGRGILNGLDLAVGPGEVHAVMGPNGSGKSTLAQVLAGRLADERTEDCVRLRGADLLGLEP